MIRRRTNATGVAGAAGVALVLLAQLALVGASLRGASPAAAAPRHNAAVNQAAVNQAPLDSAAVSALDGPVNSTDLVGDARGVSVLQAPQGSFNGFPTQGDSALILSTGDASTVANPRATRGLPVANANPVVETDLFGTDLAGAAGADGNDLTQVKIALSPPTGATCVSFDFLYLSEEFPNYVDQEFNDIFTAELNESEFELNGNQVSASNNFAYGEDQELLSVNTFTRFSPAQRSALNGKSPPLSASSPIQLGEGDLNEGAADLAIYLSVQDLGDSALDSAVVVDNLRYASGAACDQGIVSISDSDGDSLSDLWETEGIDYDGDGTPELDLPAMGADPQHKDIFVEIDWMFDAPTCITTPTVTSCPTNFKDKTPDAAAIAAMVQAFADAPVDNPDGSTGINVHVDAGRDSPMDGTQTWGARGRGNAVDYVENLGTVTNGSYDWSAFDAIKDANLDAARRDAFHYVLYANYLGTENTSGRSRGLPGGDVLVTDGPWATVGSETFSTRQEAGTLMHELGHNLELHHASERKNDPAYEDGYYSIMNYCYQLPGLQGADRNTGALAGLDYSRGSANQVNLPCRRATDLSVSTGPPRTVNALPYNDWANITFNGGSIGDLGNGAPEPTLTQEDELTEPEAVSLGVNAAPGDGVVSVLGPDLIAAGVDGQSLVLNVHNPSAERATYRVEIDEDWLDEPVTVTVPANDSKRVDLPVNVTRASDAAAPVTVSLFNGDQLLSTSTRDVHAADLTNEAVARDVSEILDQLGDDPPAGFDRRATRLLREAMEPVLAGDVTPDIEDEGGFPIWLIALMATAVVLAVVIAVGVTRRDKAGQS